MKGTVLVIEDDADVRDAIVCVLEGVGYRALSAEDGTAGLELLRSGDRPDVILLDLMMPGMDGYEFRSAQLADESIASIPVIVLTADWRRTPTADMGKVRFLQKPFELEDLLAAVSGSK